MSEPPTIAAKLTERGTQLTFVCKHCRTPHFHSLEPGLKSAHCWWNKSPYMATGYFLVVEAVA